MCALTSIFSHGSDGRCSGAIVPVSFCSSTVVTTAWKRLHRVTAGRQNDRRYRVNITTCFVNTFKLKQCREYSYLISLHIKGKKSEII